MKSGLQEHWEHRIAKSAKPYESKDKFNLQIGYLTILRCNTILSISNYK
jgi:hypothetical protein